MNIQRKNSAHHFGMLGEREQTLGTKLSPSIQNIVSIMSSTE